MDTIFCYDRSSAEHYFYSVEWVDINCPSHFHCTFEAVIVLSGTLAIEKEGNIYSVNQNEAMIMMPYERHSFQTQDHSHILVFEMSMSSLSICGRIFQNKTLQYPCIPLSQDERTFLCTHLQKAANNIIEQNCIFFTLLSLALEHTELIPCNEPDDLFRKAVIYVGDHFDEMICLKDVANALNVSYVYLSRVFSQKAKMKFSDFINSFRLQRATVLLHDPSVSISEICYSCGFGSLRNFNRIFLKIMACTPGEFRQRYACSN